MPVRRITAQAEVTLEQFYDELASHGGYATTIGNAMLALLQVLTTHWGAPTVWVLTSHITVRFTLVDDYRWVLAQVLYAPAIGYRCAYVVPVPGGVDAPMPIQQVCDTPEQVVILLQILAAQWQQTTMVPQLPMIEHRASAP